jgi:ABC-type antimicrobial peptide transport system permease subunit
MLLLLVASTIALVLGAVGVYGLMAYTVALRRREIGVRLALGATPREVRRMIAQQGVTVGAIGVAIGLVATLAATRVLRGILYDVSPTHPLTLVETCFTLLAVAWLASVVPAHRAARVDPAEALKAE